MDGVIFKDINFWLELHEAFGTLEQGKLLTEQYLHKDYDRLVEEVVVKLWKGKDARPYFDLVNSIEYLRGVDETFAHVRERGYRTAIISASSIDVARRVQRDHGVDYLFANELVIRDGKVAGEFKWPIGAGNHLKADIIRNLCTELDIASSQVAYIGDSDTDAEAFKVVGLPIAFNTKSENLKAIARSQGGRVVDSDNLADVVQYL